MRAALAVVSLALLSACGHVSIAAPHDRDVRLLPAGDTAGVRRQYRAWYAVWGLFRVSGNDPRDVIRDEALCEARIAIEDNIPDSFIGFVYTIVIPIGLVPQTIVVEGNRCRG